MSGSVFTAIGSSFEVIFRLEYHFIEVLLMRLMIPVWDLAVVISAIRLSLTKIEIRMGLPIGGGHE